MSVSCVSLSPIEPAEDNLQERKEGYLSEAEPFQNQVAGHSCANGKSVIGMLKHKEGYVMKPILKKAHGEKEKKFYIDLREATDTESVELKSFVPEYLGTSVLPIDFKDVEFLLLRNVTSDFLEPCVMDIKIGKQTWDPEASKEKRENEDKKYRTSKQELGFCIPGFQVFQLSRGKMLKMDKDYGNKLTKETTKDALRLFLNADSGLSRQLLLQLMGHLWRILRWCRTQRKYRFYSSSLLLVYDARRLQHYRAACARSKSSLAVPGTKTVLTRSKSALSIKSAAPALCRTHSFVNNFEADVQDMKDDYSFHLDSLTTFQNTCDKEEWATAKMIDFAHVFPCPSNELDVNYLEGIENLVKLFEELLGEVTC